MVGGLPGLPFGLGATTVLEPSSHYTILYYNGSQVLKSPNGTYHHELRLEQVLERWNNHALRM